MKFQLLTIHYCLATYGTSIEERAEKQVKREFRGEKESFIKTIESSIVKDKKEEIDYSNFEQRIKKMKGEN